MSKETDGLRASRCPVHLSLTISIEGHFSLKALSFQRSRVNVDASAQQEVLMHSPNLVQQAPDAARSGNAYCGLHIIHSAFFTGHATNPSGLAELPQYTECESQPAHWDQHQWPGTPSEVPLLAHTLHSSVLDIPPRLIALFSTP